MWIGPPPDRQGIAAGIRPAGQLGRAQEAAAAWETAARLADEPAIRAFLRERAADLEGGRAR